jgi:hypothetical protein
MRPLLILSILLAISYSQCSAEEATAKDDGLTIHWASNWLYIRGPKVSGGEIRVLYLEAYCRPGSTDRVWSETTIGHKTSLLEATADGKRIKLRCNVNDGIVVDHTITAGKDEVDFQLTATNPTQTESQAHWVQPCIQLEKFTGMKKDTYLPKCFIFHEGKLARMPVTPWAMTARYIPGQVWCPKHVDRNDVNPRPLSSIVPSNGLIGVFSSDEKSIAATAWEPYQELFQGVITCVHSDFRIGGLKAGETKKIRGKIYVVEAEPDALVKRYEKDFPEHVKAAEK